MKRRRRHLSSLPQKSQAVDPGTPGLHTEDKEREKRNRQLSTASPHSAMKLRDLRRDFFSMGSTRTTVSLSSSADSGTGSDSDLDRNIPVLLGTPPIIEAPMDPPAHRRRLAPPELDEVITQQTEVLAALLRRVAPPVRHELPSSSDRDSTTNGGHAPWHGIVPSRKR